ncbi:MAG: hypothetical protein LBR10_13930 [Prevotellaceae bacterium]|nr:hypothetical protein [Prevotellaceae bacterium]
MGDIRKNKRHIVAAFLMMLFVSYLASITMFVHTHIVDGQIITHSHPYCGTPDNPGHSHTAAQFLTIAHLSNLLMTGASIFVFACFLAKKTIVRNFLSRYRFERSCSAPCSLRAPPVC